MFKLENLNKPSAKNWKKIADFLLYTLPLYLAVALTLPVNENVKLWINFGLTLVIVTLKGLSKFTTDEGVA